MTGTVHSSYFYLNFPRLKKQGAAHEQASALKDKGNAVYKTGKIEEAFSIYQQAFNLDGTSGVIASNICQCLLTLNRLEEAAEWGEKCVRLSPSKFK
jgi:Flp pilus assembly protein TadD